MAWYKEWFGEEYLELYSHRDVGEAERHIDFVERTLADRSSAARPRAVLDLACGAGRHTAGLRRRGYRTLGVDLSLTLLAQRPELPRVGGDMRRLPFADTTFDWVLNFFTSFGYFEDERENFRVLEEVRRILTPGGRFLIDLLNPARTLATLEPRASEVRGGRRVEIERWYDAGKRRINKRIRLIDDPADPADPAIPSSDAAPGPRCFLESVRIYQLDEVRAALEWAGLRVLDHFGDFNGEPHDDDSERLILLAARPD